MKNFNKIIDFNKDTGEITAEAGVILSELIFKYLPIGFFPYVTPGTKYVSVGGMIASNIHGKNHHIEGSMSNYVVWVDVIQNDGSIIRCSKTDNTELFNWTIGGMGLTGIIYRACFRFKKVKSSWITSKKVITKRFITRQICCIARRTFN
jgi:FAD/FMN-containing dehydrogenase